MFISKSDFVTSGFCDSPCHGLQIEPVDVSTEFTIFIGNPVVVTAKQVHVVIVYNRGVVSDRPRLVGTLSLNLLPLMSAYESVSVIVCKFVDAVEVELIDCVERALSDVEPSIHIQFPIENERTVVASAIWLLVPKSHLVPVLMILSIHHHSTSWAHGLLLQLLRLVSLGTQLLGLFHYFKSDYI